ncbi:MAG: glutathione synthase [Oscillatoria sp. PMC 1051.18]|nr:glutathione synthase [Oscillatoria sp. PMC 1050.18]MEC5030583.1 glutathione synthase [Oscillatoria sp. PMC 1051.18]
MKFAFIIDPLNKLDPGHDSTVAMMEAAQASGHEVWVTVAEKLSIVKGQAWALLERVELEFVELIDDRWVAQENWYRVVEVSGRSLQEMNAVFMRTDPPVTIPYLYATQILDLLDPEKTLVINSPRALQAANEKLYAMQFPDVIPETIVSQDKLVIREFIEGREGGVLKPLGGKAGEGILFLNDRDRNLNSLIEISTKWGKEPVMVQDYLPAAKEGDKRIILLEGEAIGAVNRIPSGKEFRGNMAVGGRVVKTEITPREQEIISILAPKLQADRLYFVGIDVIGGYLTEINVTSPTGIREIDRLNNVRLGKQVIQWVEEKNSRF